MKSMTGYGKAQDDLGGKHFQFEIRSVNSKTFDFSCRIPSAYRELEQEIRQKVSNRLQRGKIDLSMNVSDVEAGQGLGLYKVNMAQLQVYLSQMEAVCQEMHSRGYMTQPSVDGILRLPGVCMEEKEEGVEEGLKEQIMNLLEQTLDHIDQSRMEEGAVLEQDFGKRVALIERYAREVEPFESQRVVDIRQKMEKNLQELGESNIDRNRLEQEMIYYLEKLDITEEKVRLHKHCAYFMETMKEDASGRKLAFISQEMGREINTLGSKANEANIQKLVVMMKDELEKIKEQLANIL